jgi:hypothetical protein
MVPVIDSTMPQTSEAGPPFNKPDEKSLEKHGGSVQQKHGMDDLLSPRN